MEERKSTLTKMLADWKTVIDIPNPSRDLAMKERIRKEIYLGAPETPWKSNILSLLASSEPMSDNTYSYLERVLERQENAKKEEMALVTKAATKLRSDPTAQKQRVIRSIIDFYISKDFVSPKQRKVLEDYVVDFSM